MEASFVTDSCSRGMIMAEEEEEELEEREDLVSLSSSSFMSDEEDEEEEDDATSSSSSLNSYPPSSSSSNDLQVEDRHVFEMSSLISILPFKRGLSKHYDGKSQSFASLSNVVSLEDLAKPVNAWKRKKRLKPCKRCAAGLDIHSFLSPKARVISKKPSRVSIVRRSHSFYSGSSRLPITPPHRSNSGVISDHQALLFA